MKPDTILEAVAIAVIIAAVLILILPGSLCGITGSCVGGQPSWYTHYMMTHCGRSC